MKDIVKYVMAEAAKSNVEKRKVGCVITGRPLTGGSEHIWARGYNHTDHEDVNGNIMHAEAKACEQLVAEAIVTEGFALTAYVSHPPCPACAQLLADHGITKVEVVEEFMKFDGDKLRYDLIPSSTTRALAEVLTFGARKYKPNNWKNVSQEELHRYVGAAMRHFEAYRAGEYFDPESNMPHLWHAMTNISFLIELDKPEMASDKHRY